jgi:hypothetical protein
MEGGRRGTGVGYMYLLEGSGDDIFLLSTYLPLLFSFFLSLGCYAGSGILEISSLRRVPRIFCEKLTSTVHRSLSTAVPFLSSLRLLINAP